MSEFPTRRLDEFIADGTVQLGRGDVISKDDIEAHPGHYPIYSSSAHNNGKFGEYPPLARYFNKIEHLSEVDWPLLQARNFQRNPDDPAQIERYQAEALVYGHLPTAALLGVICYTNGVKTMLESQIQARGLKLDIRAMPGWYFR